MLTIECIYFLVIGCAVYYLLMDSQQVVRAACCYVPCYQQAWRGQVWRPIIYCPLSSAALI